MSYLKKLDSDFVKSYLPTLKNLKFSGLYFFDERLGCVSLKNFGFITLIYYSVVLSFHIGGVVKKFSDGEVLTKISTHLSICVVFLEGIIIQSHLMFSRNSIRNYILDLGSEWRNDENLGPNQILVKNKLIQQFYKLNTGFFGFVYFFSITYITTPLIWNVVNKYCFDRITHYTPFDYEVGFDFRSNFAVFTCVYIFDGFAIICLGWLVLTDLWLITATMSNLYILFLMLHHDIEELFVDSDSESTEENMKIVVKRHIKLLKLLDGLSSPFGAIFAIHMAFLSAIIGFFAITAMIEKSLSALKDLTASILLVIYLYQSSYYGQLLTDSSLNVSMVIYKSAWYNADEKSKKNVLFIMLRAQKPRYITSTFFAKISLTTFTKMMNSTWSFLSLLLTMFDK